MPFTFKNTPSYEMAGQFAQEAGRAEAMPKAIQLQQQQQQLDMSRQKAAADHQYRMARQFAEAREAQYRSAEQARQKAIKEKAEENKEYLSAVSKLKTELDPAKYEGEDAVEASKFRNDLKGIENDKLLNSGVGAGSRVRKAFTNLAEKVKGSEILSKQKKMTAMEYVGKQGKVPLGVYNALRKVDAEREGIEYVPLAEDLDQQSTFVSALTRGGVLSVDIDTDERAHKRNKELEALKGEITAAGKKAERDALSTGAPEGRWNAGITPEDANERQRKEEEGIIKRLKEEVESVEREVEDLGEDDYGAELDDDQLGPEIQDQKTQLNTARSKNAEWDARFAKSKDEKDKKEAKKWSDAVDTAEENIRALRIRAKLARAKQAMEPESVSRMAVESLQGRADINSEHLKEADERRSSTEAAKGGRARAARLKDPDSQASRKLAASVRRFEGDKLVGGDHFKLLKDLEPSDPRYYMVRVTMITMEGEEDTRLLTPERAVEAMDDAYEEQLERRRALGAMDKDTVDKAVRAGAGPPGGDEQSTLRKLIGFTTGEMEDAGADKGIVDSVVRGSGQGQEEEEQSLLRKAIGFTTGEMD